MSFVEYREFNSEADNRKFTMPYIEMVNAVEYCRQYGLRVVAIDRLRTHDRGREISSSQIHKIKSERGNE